MSSTIVLLPAGAASAATELEYVQSADSRTAIGHASATVPLLPQPSGAGGELVAIAPAAALSWHRAQLPKGVGPKSPRLRAVLEGLLEERLLDDPQQLHFALSPEGISEGGSWVAVCDRAWLRGWLQALEAAGRPASRVVPEFAPEGDDVLYAIGEGEQAQLVCAGRQGVYHLPLAAASLALLPPLSEGTAVVAEPAVAGPAEQVLQHRPAVVPQHQRLLAASRTAWDLGQGEFASSGQARAFKKLSAGWGDLLREPRWRPARWGAAVLVLAQLVGLNAWAWKERSTLSAKRDAVRGVLTQTFPSVRAVVDAPVQMEREVAALRQAAGGAAARDLETMLGAVAAAAAQGRSATSVEYTGTELRLRGLASSEAEARPLLQALRSQGYAASVQGDALVVRPEALP